MAERNETTTISDDMIFKGSIETDHAMLIQGRVSGNVIARARIQIDEKADVQANVSARDLEILGSLQGNVLNAESVTLQPSARLTGDIQTAQLQIQRGAKHNGNTSMR
ncbi:MAG TPA: polymer-forming cytoskeletal protein [Turneriella sp.]|nr:polymer-forming cytoskeletal protein [Turneriella sp.]